MNSTFGMKNMRLNVASDASVDGMVDCHENVFGSGVLLNVVSFVQS